MRFKSCWPGIILIILFVAGFISFLVGDSYIQSESVPVEEAPECVQEYLPDGVETVQYAWLYVGQLSDERACFELPAEQVDNFENFLRNKADAAKPWNKEVVRGTLQSWSMVDMPQPDWWSVPADADCVYYSLWRGRDFVEVTVLPSTRRVWVSVSKV